MRNSTKPIRVLAEGLDILVASDRETIDWNDPELKEHGIILTEAGVERMKAEKPGKGRTIAPVRWKREGKNGKDSRETPGG